MKLPQPTLAHLKKARIEFMRIEPRDFFYWSITKLVSSILDTQTKPVVVNELVCALMMLLTSWNRNYYRFFKSRYSSKTFESHFADLESVVERHFVRLNAFRLQSLNHSSEIPTEDVREIFTDFTSVLGRVGAAKCLHLLAPRYFPLWDAAILKDYGMESGLHRHSTDAERYLAFMEIAQQQMVRIRKLEAFTDNPLKSLDEYNYCRFTKHVHFE